MDDNFAGANLKASSLKFIFENGEEAWIIPSRVKNEGEVFDYLAMLPRAFVKNP
jgi:hypothetical protein